MYSLYNNLTNLISHYYPSSQNQKQTIKLQVQQVIKLSKPQKIALLNQVLTKIDTYNEQQKGKIGMYFSEILESYPNFVFTTQLPPHYPSKINYQNKKQQIESMLIIFSGKLDIQAQNFKCPLLLEIVIQKNCLQTMPLFYVRNPTITKTSSKTKQTYTIKTKPNKEYCLITMSQNVNVKKSKGSSIKQRQQQQFKLPNYSYKAVMGGIQVLVPIKTQQWNWIKGSSYKSKNLKYMIDYCKQLFLKQFPFTFVKIKDSAEKDQYFNQQANIDIRTEKIYESSKKLTNYIKQHLQVSLTNKQSENIPLLPLIVQRNQQLDIKMKASLSSMKNENDQMKKYINQMQKLQSKFKQQKQQNILIKEHYPSLCEEQPYQRQLFELVCEIAALKDCMIKVEKYQFVDIDDDEGLNIQGSQFVESKKRKKILSNDELERAMVIWEQLNSRMFQKRIIINRIVQKIQKIDQSKQMN